MAEVNKEELRRWCNVEGLDEWFEFGDLLINDVDGEPRSLNEEDERWIVAADPRRILPLLEENAAQSDRIAELERECERLREDHDKEWRRSETNAQNCVALAAELEACRKDAGYWRYIRDRLGEPNDHDVHAAFHAWCWAEGPLEDVEAAIDAAMQEDAV